MRFTFSRGIAVFAIVAVASCGGRGVVPTQPSNPGIPFAGTMAPSATNPCATLDKEGTWYFHGPCIAENVKQSATIFKLKSYRSVTQILKYPAVSGKAPAKTAFVTGEATGKKDVTGTFQGTKFPLYGSSSGPCVGNYGSAQACSGKAVVYDLMVNAGTTNVSFVGSPSITLTGKVLRHKTTCTLNQLIRAGGWAYQATPVTATIAKGKVQLPQFPNTYNMDTHTVYVFAISCQ